MPGMNGVEALSAMLEIKPDAKVVMMTAYSVESLLEGAQRAGGRAVLRKPLNMDEVFRLIENLPDRIILGG
jgi:DNA-binding NarL/FixJ family response regulator